MSLTQPKGKKTLPDTKPLNGRQNGIQKTMGQSDESGVGLA